MNRTTHKSSLLALPLLLGALGAAGCQEFFSTDEACHEKVLGAAALDPLETDAMLRMNCYRRLTGVTRAHANKYVQLAAENEISYVQQNPSLNDLFGPLGAASYLTQRFENPGFSGTNARERLTAEPKEGGGGGAGYVITDALGTAIWEFIGVTYGTDDTALKSGAEAIDELMREPAFRQIALQPSYVDGAYAEGDLPQQWWIDAGWNGPADTTTARVAAATPAPEPVPVGRVYYLIVLYQQPHYEHVDRPVMLPKTDQIDVPLYSWSRNLNLYVGGEYAPTQLSYPITLLMGSVDPANFNEIDYNQYNAHISSASIVGPDGPTETEVVHPNDDPEASWPGGEQLRTTLAIFSRHPYEPDTDYHVYADLTTPEGQFTIDYGFHTAAEDPGVDPTLGINLDTTAPVASRALSPTPGAHEAPVYWIGRPIQPGVQHTPPKDAP